ncbi:hypothetical protein INR49_018926 [Caranx melampygus]|nr:hypothetical protein INR49_018926 [Caranx melampygus]
MSLGAESLAAGGGGFIIQLGRVLQVLTTGRDLLIRWATSEERDATLELLGLIPVQRPGVDVDRHRVRTFWQRCHPQRLLDTVADKQCSAGGVPQALVEVDGGEEGGAALPQPQHLVVLLLGLGGALPRVVGFVPAVVEAVGEQVEAPAPARTLADAEVDGPLHEAAAGMLELALSHFGNFF